MKYMRICAFLLASGLSLYAQSQHTHHSHHSGHHASASSIVDSMHAPMMQQALSKSGNIDKDYLVDMIPHHQGAIDSAKILLKETKNEQLRELAQGIVDTQEKEIVYFQKLLKDGFEMTNTDQRTYDKVLKANENVHKQMMQAMQQVASSGNVDKDFLQGMIAHHQGAIESSKLILQHTKSDVITGIATDIINQQEDEIKLMQQLLKEIK